MKYNKSEIMKKAWEMFRKSQKWVDPMSFGECLRRAWNAAKVIASLAAEKAEKGIVRMSCSEYKTSYSNCKTVDGSYDKRTKTIEVMTKAIKAIKIGVCPRCHTYCYGDCRAN